MPLNVVPCDILQEAVSSQVGKVLTSLARHVGRMIA